MPIYEFECASCREHFEELIRTPAEENALVCPKCNGKNIQRLFSAFGFRSGSKVVTSVAGGSESCRTCATKTCDTCR